MKDEQIVLFIQKHLGPFMRDFDVNNRGNRMSKELMIGLGVSLEEILLPVVRNLTKGETDEK